MSEYTEMDFALYDAEGEPMAVLNEQQARELKRIKHSLDIRPYHKTETQEAKPLPRMESLTQD